MKLITKDIQKKLDANLKISEDKRKPYLKLFNPCGQATWLIPSIIRKQVKCLACVT